MKEVTPEERNEFVRFWSAQRRAIEGRVSSKTMSYFNDYTANDNVGYEMGQLRPGKLGQWNLYYWLTDIEIRCDKNEALIASGLTAAEVAEEERREYYRENYVDPDNKLEILDFERQKNMSMEELDAEIAHLEALLAQSEQVKA